MDLKHMPSNDMQSIGNPLNAHVDHLQNLAQMSQQSREIGSLPVLGLHLFLIIYSTFSTT